MLKGQTLSDQLIASDNRPSGFDYLRISLAVAVVVNHTTTVLHGFDSEIPGWKGLVSGPYASFIVPAFFALSGFLVAGSLERNDLRSFLTLRGLRIFPALAVEVLLSALIIGPLLTTASLHGYFTNSAFYAYFLNILGDIHYQLPGLFVGSPAGTYVNAQLWTVPYEFECYLTITVLALLGARKRPMWLFIALIIFSAGMTLRQNLTGHLPGQYGPLGGRFSVLTFLFGVMLYFLRTRIQSNRWLFLTAAVLSFAFLHERRFVWISGLPVAYVTVYLGLLNPRRLFVIRSADYSYGVYLYGFVIQQTVAWLLPANLRLWYVHLPLSLIVAGICAWCSWTFVEAPIMSRKKIVLTAVHRLPHWRPQAKMVAEQP